MKKVKVLYKNEKEVIWTKIFFFIVGIGSILWGIYTLFFAKSPWASDILVKAWSIPAFLFAFFVFMVLFTQEPIIEEK